MSIQNPTKATVPTKHNSQTVTRLEAIQQMPNELINIESLHGVGHKLATRLREAGFSTIPDIHHNKKEKLMLIDGIGYTSARGMKSSAASRCSYHFGDYEWKPFKQYDPMKK